jgi:HK97 family phage major capsid protein
VTNSKTAVSGVLGSPSEFTLAHFRTLRGVPDASALRVGAYYLHPSFEQLLNTFNTSGNRPYNPAAQIQGTGAQPFATGPTLDGFPVRWVDVLPVYTTADALSTVFALFGDVSFQYLGVRGGMRFDTSTEAGFATDEILVRALQRMTTGLMATGAVGGLITHSS